MGKANEFLDAGIADFYRGDAARALREGKTPGDTRELIQQAILRSGATAARPNFVDGLTETERESYSIVRALRHLAEKAENPRADFRADLEVEVGKHIQKTLGKNTAGMFVPTALHTRSGLDTKSATS